ncbi:hypothetical protein ATN83_1218 [Raoultella ornithinolytica]|nr:hypothetical protein ATN83_1218 [Raoultella ornithinolytica]
MSVGLTFVLFISDRNSTFYIFSCSSQYKDSAVSNIIYCDGLLSFT